MQVGLTRLRDGELEMGGLIGTVSLLLLLMLRLMPELTVLLPACPFLGLTGIPCPTCGVTRAALSVAKGNLAAAFIWNPLATAFLVGGGLLLAGSIYAAAVHKSRFNVFLVQREKERAAAAFLILVGVNWSYLAFSLPR